MAHSPAGGRRQEPDHPPASADTTADLAQRYSEACALLEITRALLGVGETREVLSRFLHACLGVFGASHAVGYLYRPRLGRLESSVAFGFTIPPSAESLTLSPRNRSFLAGIPGAFAPGSGAPTRAANLPSGLRRWMERLDAAVLLPIAVGPRLVAVGILGPRVGTGRYGFEDLALLDRALAMGSHAIESALTRRDDEGREVHFPTEPTAAAAVQRRPARRLQELRAQHPSLRRILGESPALLRLLEEAVSVAPTRCPVLIQGETGSGKELFARAVHEMSPRAQGPFEVVDCGSIPKELIESELFGHERGAFTGALRDRHGLFEMAHRGTIFLDELGELPIGCQTRLLRVLQEGCFRRVGGESTVRVDVRVVAATNRDLWTEVEAGRFRQDLYYRVSVLTLTFPPLRERASDIPLLARHFASVAAEELGAPLLEIDAALERRLMEHDYPGNVRELQNLVTALAVGGRGGSPAAELGRIIRRPFGWNRDGPVEPVKRGQPSLGEWVVRHLRRHGFNVAAAGRSLRRVQSTDGTRGAPVADRTTLSYYFQGECLREFCEAGFDVNRAVGELAGDEVLHGVVERRLRALLANVAESARSSGEIRIAHEACARRIGKLPASYQPYLSQAIRGYFDRRWEVGR